MKRFIAFLMLGVATVSAAPPATYVPRAIKELDDARGVSLSLKFVPMWDGTKFTPRFVLQSDVTNLVTALAAKEPALGNPSVNGYVLASTTLGERSWVVPGTGPQGPPGADGADGANGAAGANGTAATIAVGTVTTGAPGSSATVTNAGTSSAATFNFAIPRGDVGATGAAGSDAVASDTAYDATSWNGVTTIAPSKNAVRDKFETLGTLSTQSGTFSGTSSGTNTGDNAVNSLYSGLVSNATHTGDVTGATALTLATAQPAVHTWALAQTFTVAPVFTDQSGTRTALGLGTLATQSGTFSGTSSGTNTGDQTNITGNAATVTTNANLTGHVTSVGNAAVLGSFTFAQLNTAISDADTARTDAANSFTGVQTFSNQILDSYTSTASTPAIYATGSWLTGGTGTTNFPHFLLQATGTTASTTWSTAGTGIGVNAVTGFTGNLIDLKLAGTSNFKVTSAGGIAATGSITGVTSIGASQQVSVSAGNAQIYGPSDKVIRLSNSAGAGPTRINFTNDSNSFSAITGDLVNSLTLTSAAGTTTYNDPATAGSGTVANRYLFGIAAPTLTATNATVTDTVASTVYIGGAPTASTNTTIGTPYALNVAAGNTNLGGNLTVGGTVNKVTVTPPATSATLTIANSGSLITSGAFSTTLTSTGTTNVTLPTSGTLATTTQAAHSGGVIGTASFASHTGTITSLVKDGVIDTVTYVSTGEYIVAFTSSQPDTNYLVIVNGSSTVPVIASIIWDSKDVAGFSINVFDSTDTSADARLVQFAVMRLSL